MSQASQRGAKLPWVARLAMATMALGVLTLLFTAACLTPSPQGYGTHRQLGLPDCTFVTVFGRRCPSCGMTTSWAYLTHGHPWAAIRANAGGAWLGTLSLVFGPWTLASAVAGRWVGRGVPDTWMLLLGLSVIGVTLVDWAVRLALGL